MDGSQMGSVMRNMNIKTTIKLTAALALMYMIYAATSYFFVKTKVDKIAGTYNAAGINLKFANGSAMVCKDNDSEIVFEKAGPGAGDNRADIYGRRWSIEIGYPKSYLVAGGKRVSLENCLLQQENPSTF